MKGRINLNKQHKNYLIRFLRCLFSFLSEYVPIRKNRIVCYSFNGGQYSCSPKAISEYLEKKYPEKFEIIWAFRKNTSVEKNKMLNKFTVVPYNSLRFLYYYASAKFIITNIYPYQLLKTKSGQIVIDTWHGGGAYKVAGFDLNNKNQDNKKLLSEMEFNTKNISLFISSSKMFTKHFIRSGLRFKGKVLKTGLQRNDIFFLSPEEKEKIKQKTFKKIGLEKNTHFCLYAPTWKYDEKYPFVFHAKTLSKALEQRFGGKWVIVTRMHHLAKNKINGNVIDASNYPDMQELLLSADFLISDYSSAIWDYSLTHKPCLLYTYDLKNYLDKRSMYIDIKKWGFPLCETFDELINAIVTFDEADFVERMKYHYNLMGGYDKGNACKQLADFILRQI